MKTYTINKVFNSLEECNAWEEENCPDRTYNGEMIMMINHSQNCGDPHITLDSITTI